MSQTPVCIHQCRFVNDQWGGKPKLEDRRIYQLGRRFIEIEFHWLSNDLHEAATAAETPVFYQLRHFDGISWHHLFGGGKPQTGNEDALRQALLTIAHTLLAGKAPEPLAAHEIDALMAEIITPST